MKLTKINLSELLIKQCDLPMNKDSVMKMIFRNIKSDCSHFGLTYKGFQIMKYAQFKLYKIKIKDKLTMKALLNLDRNCPAPYYINGKKTYVFMFSEKPAVVLQLLDGDLQNFQL